MKFDMRESNSRSQEAKEENNIPPFIIINPCMAHRLVGYAAEFSIAGNPIGLKELVIRIPLNLTAAADAVLDELMEIDRMHVANELIKEYQKEERQ